MKRLGYFLIAAAFLAGAYLLVLDERAVAWFPFLGVLAVGAVGVAVARRARRLEAGQEERQSANVQTLRTSLRRVVEEVERLAVEKRGVDVYDLRRRIDDRLRTDLEVFADARDVLAQLYGLQAYAEVMSRFAAGERYLNRVWSASTDGYIDEAHTYIDRARDQLADARRCLEDLFASVES